jgi:uncharacterized membrane protein
MEDILIVVFDNEGSAYEGLNYLNQLDRSGAIDLYAGWVIEKEADGRITEKGWQGNFAFHTIAGTAPGLLIGLFGGPAGVGIGPTVGGLTGIKRDLHADGVNSHFVNDVATVLKPGKFAMVADVNDEHGTPIDTRMEAMGGAVFRTEKQDFEDEVRALEIAQIRDQVDQLKRDDLIATPDGKARIQAQLNSLDQKLREAEAEADQRARHQKP